MVNLKKYIPGMFPEHTGLKPGLYHYRRDLADRQMRLHLRVDPDGAGLLTVNAAGVLHLNPTAVDLMKYVLDGADMETAVAAVRKAYRATKTEVESDYKKILDIVTTLDTVEDACPIWRIDVPLVTPFDRVVSAPYRADLALTYTCNNECQHCYVARDPNEIKPLSCEEWKRVLEKLWALGVPHVCFTGGEATLSPHLVELVEKAEDIGMITGLLTNGCKLLERDFVRKLVAAGLDHVQITIESHDEKIHDEMVGMPGAFKKTVEGIKNAIAEDIYLVTNTTISTKNEGGIEETVRFLNELGVRQFAMNSLIYTGKAPDSGIGIEETDLDAILAAVVNVAQDLGMRFIWYTPTRYCELNPTTFDLGLKRCTAAEYNVCIEPDGQVIPCQSYYQPAGNILQEDWDTIWNHPLFLKIRNRSEIPELCIECPDLDVCGAGCPLSDGKQFVCSDSPSEG